MPCLPCAKLHHGDLGSHGGMPAQPNGERHESEGDRQTIQIPEGFSWDVDGMLYNGMLMAFGCIWPNWHMLEISSYQIGALNSEP
jgi:hypothetical protein